MTDAERKVWSGLRRNQLDTKFRRQVPFGPYILDFYCARAKLCVELDGSQHCVEEGRRKDLVRDAYLRKHEVQVLRFSDVEALKNTAGVLQAIFEKIHERLRHETPS